MKTTAKMFCLLVLIAASIVQAASVTDLVGANDCFQLDRSGKTIANGSITLKAIGMKADYDPSGVIQATFTNVASRDPDNPAGALVNGVQYSYYEGNWTKIPDVESLEAKKRGLADNITLDVKDRADNFVIRFETYFDAPASGTYKFYTYSNDGSILYIGDTKIVDNDSAHAEQEKSGSISLNAGKHKLIVDFLEITGAEVLTVSYEGPGSTKRPVPATSLFRQAPPVQLIAPLGGETFEAGKTMIIKWKSNNEIEFNDCVIKLSKDNGKSWMLVTIDASIGVADSNWGNYYFQIPSELRGTSTISDSCQIMIHQYNRENIYDRSAGVFKIGAASAVIGAPGRGSIQKPGLRLVHNKLIGISGDQSWTLFDVRGKVIMHSSNDRPLAIANGLGIVRYNDAARQEQAKSITIGK